MVLLGWIGIFDCPDDGDENKAACDRRKNCQQNEIKCKSTGECIAKTKFCDRVRDCDDSTDEPEVCSCFSYLEYV